MALQALDQAGVDQHAVKSARLRAAITAIEKAMATFQDRLLLDKRRIERHPRSLLHQQWNIRCIECVEGGR